MNAISGTLFDGKRFAALSLLQHANGKFKRYYLAKNPRDQVSGYGIRMAPPATYEGA